MAYSVPHAQHNQIEQRKRSNWKENVWLVIRMLVLLYILLFLVFSFSF